MNVEELNDSELSGVNAGTNWEAFGTYVLAYVDPARYPELTAAIVSRNWIQVAIISAPLMAGGDPDLIAAFTQANM